TSPAFGLRLSASGGGYFRPNSDFINPAAFAIVPGSLTAADAAPPTSGTNTGADVVPVIRNGMPASGRPNEAVDTILPVVPAVRLSAASILKSSAPLGAMVPLPSRRPIAGTTQASPFAAMPSGATRRVTLSV